MGALGWKELYSKWKKKGLNVNLDTMKDQYICHAQWATLYFRGSNVTWNLDEWRKDRSYAVTVRYRCNPPAGGKYRH